ncbi:MAG: DUF2470 domain-containing protein [Rhizobiaceae bacterium]
MADNPPDREPRNLLRQTDADAVALAASLVRCARFGAIAFTGPDGAPEASRVATATALDGAPIILASTLAAHTRAILADPRCGLLLGEPGKGDPLAHPRISLSCQARRLERDSDEGRHARRRFLNRNPKSALYADFPDFAFFRLEPLAGSLNGGFGKAYALAPGHLLHPASLALADVEQSAIVHMNTDHRDAVQAIAANLARRKGAGWFITGIDSGGLDLVRGDETARVAFPHPVSDATMLRQQLIGLTGLARDGFD